MTLSKHGLELIRGKTHMLQVNVGLICNQECRHCHLSCGPGRTEIMTRDTLNEVIAFAHKNQFEAIDITGGAPELHPDLFTMIERLAPLTPRLMVRSNLSAMEENEPERFIDLFGTHKAVVVGSFPSPNPGQLESQRGKGIFDKSINALKRLNAAGYGKEGTGLELDLDESKAELDISDLELDLADTEPETANIEPDEPEEAIDLADIGLEIPEEEAAYFEVDGRHVFVYRKGDDIKVYDSRCPHQVTDIPHLSLQGKTLTCPKHEWAFDIESGECIAKGKRPLRSFEHKTEGDRLLAYW